MKKPSAFKLNGKPLPVIHMPGAVTRIIEFVSKMKDGELLSTPEMAKEIRCPIDTLQSGGRRITQHELLAQFRANIRYPRASTVWGNAKTIRELLKHKELIA